jgi:PHP family Zn ribbon phosphoesterase
MTATANRSVSCPRCATIYRLPAAFSKKSAPCRKCGTTMRIRVCATRSKTPNLAAEAVRERSTQAQRARGVRPRARVSRIHVATGIVTLAALVAAAVIGLS